MVTSTSISLDDLRRWSSEKLFQKRFDFDYRHPSTLESNHGREEDAESQRELFTRLSELRERSIRTRAQLRAVDIHKWGEHTSYLDHSGWVMKRVRHRMDMDINLVDVRPFVTRGWLKLYEILFAFDFEELLKDRDHLWVGFLCEAPGGFVSALQYFTHVHLPHITCNKFHWVASSLHPHNEDNKEIKDDRFIFRDKATRTRWYFGPDGSGDIFQNGFTNGLRHFMMTMMAANSSVKDNREELTGEPRILDIITADGSVNCADRPEDQEETVFPLIRREVDTALELLRPRGHFVLKLFTAFQPQTVRLISTLICSFEFVSLYKPAMSKEGNSEMYLVCRNFRGPHITPPLPSVNPPAPLHSQLLQGAQLFTQFQETVINRNLILYNELDLCAASETTLNGIQEADEADQTQRAFHAQIRRNKQRSWEYYRILTKL